MHLPSVALLLVGLLAVHPLSAKPSATEMDRLRHTTFADICIYGGTSSGLAAAIQARRMGRSVVVLEPSQHLGGLTTGGLGATDSGRRNAIGGIAAEFYRRVKAYYVETYGADSQPVKDCSGGFRFEPHVASLVFRQMLDEVGVAIHCGERLGGLEFRDRTIRTLLTSTGRRVKAWYYLDCTYEGDLLAAAKVSYTTGREANSVYGETIDGVQPNQGAHNFRAKVDPYVVPGDPSSGLLLGIHAGGPGEQGSGDRRIQAYNFRMCLTRNRDNQLPFPKPLGYNPARYELLARYLAAGVWDALRLSTPMPNGKTDTNNHGAFSTDNIGLNYDYPEGDWATRERIIQDHINYQQGLMWFLCHDERVPEKIRDEVNQWGLAADEFQATGGWPPQLYVREARRMVSDYVVTEQNCRGTEDVDDPVGLGSYGMDSHHTQRYVRDGYARNEGDVQVGGFPPYRIPYRSIVPKRGECDNLLVSVCISTSHIAYGSARMEPVFMILGQSAATAASLAFDRHCSVQALPYPALEAQLRADGQKLDGGHDFNRIDPKSLPGIALDDADGTRTGFWKASTIPQMRLLGTGYLHDSNQFKGQTSITWTPEIPKAGRYELILLSPPNPNRATNVPVTLTIKGREPVKLTLDQRNSETGRTSLGVFELPAGRQTTITLSNSDTDGYVVADGIQLKPVEEE